MPASASTICRPDRRQRTGEWLDGIGRLAGKTFAPEVAALLGPYLDAVGLDGRRRRDQVLSRLAADRPAPFAQAGQAVRDRASSRRCGASSGSSLPATSRRACLNSTAGWRSARNCRPRNGAGWCWSTRPSRSRANSSAWPTRSPRRTTAGRAASMRCGIRSRTARRSPPSATGSGRPASRRSSTSASTSAAPSPEPRLDGCGMAIVNPPYPLEAEMKAVLPALHALLAEDPRADLVDGMAGPRMSRQGLRPSPSSISYGSNGGNLSV